MTPLDVLVRKNGNASHFFFAPISFDCCQFLRRCSELEAAYLGTRRTQRIACCTCFLMLAFSKCPRAKIKLCLFHVVFHI